MGIFDFLSDPNVMTLAQGIGQAATPIPGRTGMGWGTGLLGTFGNLAGAANQAQEFQKGQLSNQMGQLQLQRAQAMQPMFLNQINGMANPSLAQSGNVNGSTADAQFQQAYQLALMSGKTEDAAKVLQSWAEHNPSLAGSITNAQERNKLVELPDGTKVLGGTLMGSVPGSLSPQMQSTIPAPSPVPSKPSAAPMSQSNSEKINSLFGGDVAPNLTAAVNGKQVSVPNTSLGTPIIPEASNIAKYPPSPFGQPAWPSLPNTKDGQKQKDANIADMTKGEDEFATLARSNSIEKSRIDNLIQDYQNVQTGTLTGLHPETAQYLSALGLLDPKKQADLSKIQSAMTNNILDVLSQVRDTNSSVGGGANVRAFAAEYNKLLDDQSKNKLQPPAVYELLTQAKGLTDQTSDMIQGWDSIGGRANRALNGDTMLPSQYINKFYGNKDNETQKYIDAAMKRTAPFKGMAGNQQAVAKTIAKQMFSPRTGKHKIIYTDGTEIIQ